MADIHVNSTVFYITNKSDEDGVVLAKWGRCISGRFRLYFEGWEMFSLEEYLEDIVLWFEGAGICLVVLGEEEFGVVF